MSHVQGPVVHTGKRPRRRRRPVTAGDLGWPGLAMAGFGALLHISIAFSTYERVPPQFFVIWLIGANVVFAGAALRARAPWSVRINGALLNLLYTPFGLAYLLA